MAEKISQEELDKLKGKRGVKVRRRMGEQPKPEVEPEVPTNEVVSPQKEVEHTQPHAAMAASMAAHEGEMRRIADSTSAKIAEFSQQLAEIALNSKASEYTFDMQRDDRELLTRVHARPGIHND